MPRYRERRSRPAPNPASPLWQLPASAREVVREATPVGDATLVSVVLALGVPGRLPGLEAPGLPVVEALLAPLATTLPEGASPGAIGCAAHQRDPLRTERLRLIGERLLRGDLVRLRLLVDLGLHLIVRESRAAPDEEAAEHEQHPGGGDRGRQTDPESGALAIRGGTGGTGAAAYPSGGMGGAGGAGIAGAAAGMTTVGASLAGISTGGGAPACGPSITTGAGSAIWLLLWSIDVLPRADERRRDAAEKSGM